MKYLFEDDRTDLPDTLLWQKIFGGMIRHLFETEKAYFLQKRLWTLRSMGMMIKLIFKELEADNHGINRPVLSKKATP